MCSETDSKLFPMLFLTMMMAVSKVPKKSWRARLPNRAQFGRHLDTFKTGFKANAKGLGAAVNKSVASVKMWTIAKVGALGGSLALIWTAFTQPNFITDTINRFIVEVVGLPEAEPETINMALIVIVCAIAVGILLFISRRK